MNTAPQKAMGGFMAWMMWLATASFYSFQFFVRSSPNAMSGQLMDTFHIGAPMLGVFTAAYYWSYAALQIPVGIFLDVLGPKKMLRVGSTLCVLGTVFFALADSLVFAILARCLIGAGAAVAFIGSIKMNTLWFPAARLAFVIGLLSSLGKIGGAAANAFLPVLIAYVQSWRGVILGLSAIGALSSLTIWLFVKNGPKDIFHPLAKGADWRALLSSVRSEFLLVIASPVTWCLGLYGYAMYLTLSVFSDAYSIAFLQKLLSVSGTLAGRMSALVPIGSCCGAAVIPYLSDRIGRRKPFLYVSAACTIVFSGIVFFGSVTSFTLLGLCLFLFGFFSAGQVLVFAVSAENMPPRLSGMAVGTVNAILMLGGSLHNPLVGGLLKLFWDGRYEGGRPLYDLAAFRGAFASISFFFVLAFLVTFFVPETHPLSRKKR